MVGGCASLPILLCLAFFFLMRSEEQKPRKSKKKKSKDTDDDSGKKKKSASRANVIIMAVNKPIPEFSAKCDCASTIKPATSTIEVVSNARPT